jgi:hypothetical protein
MKSIKGWRGERKAEDGTSFSVQITVDEASKVRIELGRQDSGGQHNGCVISSDAECFDLLLDTMQRAVSLLEPDEDVRDEDVDGTLQAAHDPDRDAGGPAEKVQWYVADDPDNRTYDTKIEAETRARVLFPSESPDKRYARVSYRQVELPHNRVRLSSLETGAHFIVPWESKTDVWRVLAIPPDMREALRNLATMYAECKGKVRGFGDEMLVDRVD